MSDQNSQRPLSSRQRDALRARTRAAQCARWDRDFQVEQGLRNGT